MDFDNARNKILSRVLKSGYGVKFTYNEIDEWLKIAPEDDPIWVFEQLEQQMVIKHSVILEPDDENLTANIPLEIDMKAALLQIAEMVKENGKH